jgi:hypothetical protein
MKREVWGYFDARTGARVSVTSAFTREQAERQIEEWRERDRKGKRPDIHDLMPHLEARQLS